MSSTPQRQGLPKKQSLLNGVTNFRSVKTRLFAASVLLLAAVYFSASAIAANPNQSILATSSANTQQAGFVASAITDLLSFFGLVEAAPVAVVSPQVCVAPPAAAAMTAWFPGNGTTADIAPQDTVDDVATLTNGATYSPAGRVGQGFLLDGTNDYVAVATSVDIDVEDRPGATGISMDAWINPDSITPVGQPGFPIAEYGISSDYGVHFWHSVGGSGNLFVNVVDGTSGADRFFFTTTNPVTVGTLQHVAFTYSTTTGVPAIYYNGVAQPLDVVGLAPFPTTIETSYPLNIGARLDTGVGVAFFDGIIDEFELFDEAITALDVAAIFNAPAGEGKCSGTFQFSQAAQTTPEAGAPTILATVTRTGDTTVPATVDVFTAPGSAVSVDGTGCAPGNDFQGFSAPNAITLAFPAGTSGAALSQQVGVQICDDAIAEPDETFTLNLTNPTGPSNVGTPATQTVTITDAADTPVSVTVSPASVPEDGAGNLIYTFSRGDAGAGAITVNFAISGSATAPPAATADYACSNGTGATAATCTGTTGTVTFDATATTAQVVVDPIADSDATEGDDTVTFTVTAGTGYSVGTPSSATGTITEDDTDVSVAVAPASVTENGTTNLVFTFTRSGATPAGQVVNFSVTGTACSLAPCTDNFPPDYTQTGATSFTGTNGTVAGTGSVTFTGAATTATVTVDPTPDSNVEPDETVTFTVTASTGIDPVAPTSATGTITNDDTTYTIAVAAVQVVTTPANPAPLEGNSNNIPNPQTGGTQAGSFATFTVTRTGLTTSTGQVDVATDPLTGTATPGTQNTACGLTPGVDYITDGATLTFAAGETTMTFTVAVCGDTTFELDETFEAFLSNPVNGTLGVPSRATYTIVNDDTAPILDISDGAAVEGANVVFTVSQVNAGGGAQASGTATTFRVCTTDVTATEGVDYDGFPCTGPGSGPFTIPAGSTSTTVSIPTDDDALFEGAETFLIDLIDVTNATIGDGQGVGTITDGEQPNVFTVNDVAQAEGSTPAGTTSFNFIITRSGPAQANQVVCYRTQTGTTIPPGNANPATPGTAPGNPPGADYTEIVSNPPNNCVTFTAGGPDSIVVPVIVYQDDVFENDETFTFIIESVTGGPAGVDFSDTGLGTILNDDLAPTIRITPNAVNQSEAITPYGFTVTRTGRSQLPVTFNFATASGTATGGAACTAGVDFISQSGTRTIPGSPDSAASTTATSVINVVICNDTIDEPNEAFTVSISNIANATLLVAADATATGVILDDDAGPIVTVSDVTMAEGNVGTTPFVFTITLSGNPTTQPVVVTYSTVDGTATVADNDYQPIIAGTQTFAPGETSKTVTVLVNGDLNFETDERFTLQVTSATNASLDPLLGAKAIGLGTILNDDGPATFAIDNVTQNEGNDPANPVLFRFRVTRTGSSAITQSITFTTQNGTATGGAACANPGTGAIDFIPQTGTLVFVPGGANFQDILVPVCGDLVFENNETFTVTIASTTPGEVPTAGSVGTGTIVNDDALSFRVDNVTGQEGNAGTTNFVFRISKDGTTSLSSSVSFVIENGTATGGAACGPGVDFISTPSPASPVVFAAGTTFVNVTIQVCGDLLFEGDETFFLRLTGATNGTISTTNGTGIGTIVNDDPPAPFPGLEGDINRAVVGVCGPGDGTHTATDSAQFKRFIAGLDTPCTGDGTLGTFNEFQRADVTPIATLGDGRLDATDQQQIDNDIAQLSPDRAAGGPTAPIPPPAPGQAERSAGIVKGDKDDIAIETGGGREFRGVFVEGSPDTFVSYAVELISQGDETVTTFSLQFDQTRLSISNVSGTNNNPDVTNGTGANPGTSRTVNGTQVGMGRIGVLLDFQGAVAAGTRQIVVFRFRILPTAPAGLTPVTFVDQPIVRSTSNALAQSLPAKYTPNNVNVIAPPMPGVRTLTIGSVVAPNGGQAVVPVTLNSQGDETAISGSISFVTTQLTTPTIVLGSGAPAGCSLTTNVTQVANGNIGFLVACPTAFVASPPSREVIRITFAVPAQNPVPRTTPLTWGDAPVARAVSNAQAASLTTTYVNGSVTVEIATAATRALSGRVTDANGAGLRNAMITVSGGGLVDPIRVVTGSLGYYNVENLEVGQTYVVSLRASKRYSFSNATRLVTLSDNAQDVDFTADPQ